MRSISTKTKALNKFHPTNKIELKNSLGKIEQVFDCQAQLQKLSFKNAVY